MSLFRLGTGLAGVWEVRVKLRMALCTACCAGEVIDRGIDANPVAISLP